MNNEERSAYINLQETIVVFNQQTTELNQIRQPLNLDTVISLELKRKKQLNTKERLTINSHYETHQLHTL
ncbi:hypothetical protein Hanom_Chr12g01144511 [Helianthus anomalus]